jgi:adenine-specific DNA-methyltransferase
MDLTSFLQPQADKNNAIKQIYSIANNYVGNKKRLLNFIPDVLLENNIEYDSVFDVFTGSGVVAALFALLGKKVYCNDILSSSAMIVNCMVGNVCEEITPYIYDKPSPVKHFSIQDKYYNLFTSEEISFLENIRNNFIHHFGSDINTGKKLSNGAFHQPITRTAAQHAMKLWSIVNHINQHCFVGGRYYNGQIIAEKDHRINHDKNKGKTIDQIPIKTSRIKNLCPKSYVEVFNCDSISLLEENAINSDIAYIDPPYGGDSSDYFGLYQFIEDFVTVNKNPKNNNYHRFTKSKNYESEFNILLDLCSKFRIWLLSYNESSFANIDKIVDIIKQHGRNNVVAKEIPITYQYRGEKNEIDINDFKDNYYDNGHTFNKRGIEYLIMAT